MKILITGCTAQQASAKAVGRFPSFSSCLMGMLRSDGHEVELLVPSVHMDKDFLSSYDAVLVGVAPLTSLSANYFYPAAIVSEHARELDRLFLFLDAPEPIKIQHSLISVVANPESLYKELYSRRKDYRAASVDEYFTDKIRSFLSFLSSEPWPTTFYPSLPWIDSSFSDQVSGLNSKNLVSVSVDDYLLSRFSEQEIVDSPAKSLFWVADYTNTQWIRRINKTLEYPVTSVRGSQWEDVSDSLIRIYNAVGTLISTHTSGKAWWSPHLALSLSVGTPVITDWLLSESIGSGEWSTLAQSVESKTKEEREQLAVQQKISYLESIPNQKETTSKLLNTLN